MSYAQEKKQSWTLNVKPPSAYVITETMNIIQEHKQLATHSVQLNVFSLEHLPRKVMQKIKVTVYTLELLF